MNKFGRHGKPGKRTAKQQYEYDRHNTVERFCYLYLYRRKLRNKVHKALGGKCATCGFKDPRCLQIDHRRGKGGKHRRKLTEYQFLNAVLRSAKRGSKAFQLLCANCNWIKRHVRREFRSKYAPKELT